jgi:hypothetical protein
MLAPGAMGESRQIATGKTQLKERRRIGVSLTDYDSYFVALRDPMK